MGLRHMIQPGEESIFVYGDHPEPVAMTEDGPIADVVDELLGLSPPEESGLSTATTRQLVETTKRFRKLWLELITQGSTLKIDKAHVTADQFWDLALRVGGTFDYAVHRILSADDRPKSRPTAFVLSDIDHVHEVTGRLQDKLQKDPEAVTPIDIANLVAGQLLADYILYLIAAGVLSIPNSWAFPPSMIAFFERQLHNPLSRIADRLGQVPELADELVGRIVKNGLAQAAHFAVERESTTNLGHTPGSFSWLRPDELAPIAERSEAMVKRYGKNEVESVFEQQIALIFQSFGFLVIPTRPGERSVDLLCLSNDGPNSSSLMVEAKTTKGYYALPPRDQRALKEYVETVKRSMRTLPELKLIVIVAPKGASTLEAKLTKLANEVQLPIRFLPAQALADLREAAPGAIPSDLLIGALLAQPEIVTDELAKDVSLRLRKLQEAHQQLAKELGAAWER